MVFTQFFLAVEYARRALRTAAVFLSGGEPCLCCGAVTLLPGLCERCRKQFLSWRPFFTPAERPLEPQVAARCRICGKPLLSESAVCLSCRTKRVLFHTDGVFPLHAYRLWNKTLLFNWKIEGNRALSPLFAAAVHAAVSSLYACFGRTLPVVPVPPRPGKIRRTGWDQIAELSRLLEIEYGIPVLPLLARLSSVQQKKLARAERILGKGSSYVFAPPRRLRQKAVPEEVILLDDVLTTGATVEHCAKVLKSAGVRRVYAVTLFIVD